MSAIRQVSGSAPARLERRLGVTGLAVHFVCSVLGAGILILPGIALVLAGPASILAWVFLVGFSFLFAWVLARLSVEYPDCHGLPLFVRNAFGPDWERGLAALLALAMAAGVIPVYGIAAARRLAALGLVPADAPPAVIGGAVILAAIALNLAGLQLGLRLQTAMVGVVVAVLVCAIVLAAPHARPVDVLAVPPDGWSAVGLAIAVCFFAVIGWENAAPMAEEVADPARTVPRAAMLAATLVGLLYLGFATMLAMTVGDGRGTPARRWPRCSRPRSGRPATSPATRSRSGSSFSPPTPGCSPPRARSTAWRAMACCRPGSTA